MNKYYAIIVLVFNLNLIGLLWSSYLFWTRGGMNLIGMSVNLAVCIYISKTLWKFWPVRGRSV